MGANTRRSTAGRAGWARPLAALGVAGVVSTVVLMSPTPIPASATESQAEDAGAIAIVAHSGSSRPLNRGGSAVEFSFRLPDGASCPGDSANDNYLVQSYMVPVTVGSADVGYDGLGPAPNSYGDWATFRQPFYDTRTTPYASVLTAEAVAPGQPGPIVNIPALSFAVYKPGQLPPGRYRIGVACTLFNKVVKYWDGELVVTLAADDNPVGVTWALADPPGGAAGSGPAFPGAAAAGLVAAVVITGVCARRRLRPRT